MHQTVAWMRAHEGIMRAALQRGDAPESKWSTFKNLARATVTAATPLLLRAMGPGQRAAKTRAIGFGFQVTNGTLVNAILNDPGPLSLHNEEMPKRLSRCLQLLLQTEMTTPSTKMAAPKTAKRRKGTTKTTT
jgi:hypothetical protein